MNLFEVTQEIANRLTRIFLRDEHGRRPVYGGAAKFQNDPHWAAADPAAKRAEIIENYQNLLYNPYIAASRGFVDQVIAPRETRPRLIEAFEAMSSKRETLPAKKHGNIPV